MKEHVDKRLVVIMLLVCLLVAPWPSGTVTVEAHARNKAEACKMTRRWEYLLGSTAFVLGFTPFTPVAVIYGAAALGAKAYEVLVLDC